MGGGGVSETGKARVCGCGIDNGNGPDRGRGDRGSSSCRWRGRVIYSGGSSGGGRGSGIQNVVVVGVVALRWW